MTIIIGIILLGFLVFIHELGHFVAARACGVKVEAFSIGMGPVLLHKEWKNTDWRLSLFPFGGYCAMKGEKDFEESYSSNTVLPEDSFYGVKAFFRSIIGFAGPLSNFLFSVVAFSIIAITGYTYYSAGNTIQLANEVYPELHSAAADAGLKSGDKVININGREIKEFTALYEEIATHPDEDINVIVDRDGEKLTFTVHTDCNKSTGEGKIGVISDPSSVQAREAARYSFFPAIGKGFSETFRMIYLSVKGIASLFKGANIAESVAGPARITSMMGQTAKSGFNMGLRNGVVSILQFMALVSVSLFIMNLLPVPVLDGFLVLTSLFEAVTGVRLPPSIRKAAQIAGLILITGLFLLAMTGDFHYFAGLLGKK